MLCDVKQLAPKPSFWPQHQHQRNRAFHGPQLTETSSQGCEALWPLEMKLHLAAVHSPAPRVPAGAQRPEHSSPSGGQLGHLEGSSACAPVGMCPAVLPG